MKLFDGSSALNEAKGERRKKYKVTINSNQIPIKNFYRAGEIDCREKRLKSNLLIQNRREFSRLFRSRINPGF